MWLKIRFYNFNQYDDFPFPDNINNIKVAIKNYWIFWFFDKLVSKILASITKWEYRSHDMYSTVVQYNLFYYYLNNHFKKALVLSYNFPYHYAIVCWNLPFSNSNEESEKKDYKGIIKIGAI